MLSWLVMLLRLLLLLLLLHRLLLRWGPVQVFHLGLHSILRSAICCLSIVCPASLRLRQASSAVMLLRGFRLLDASGPSISGFVGRALQSRLLGRLVARSVESVRCAGFLLFRWSGTADDTEVPEHQIGDENLLNQWSTSIRQLDVRQTVNRSLDMDRVTGKVRETG